MRESYTGAPGPSTDNQSGWPDSAAWAQHAPALAAWTDKHLVNRRDAYGGYYVRDGAVHTTTRKATDKAGPLTLATLVRHFKATGTDAVIGLHSTYRDEAGECWSRWLGIDVDRHDEGSDPEANTRFVLAVYALAVSLGFRVILTDSDGRGGYHIRLVFAGPVPTRLVFAFARWLIREWESYRLTKEPETFPKQPGIPEGGYGNWMRVFGRHPKRDHWSRVYDGERWIDGVDAVKFIVTTTGADESLIPTEARPDPNAPFDLGREIARKRAQEASEANIEANGDSSGHAVDLGRKGKREKAGDGTTEPGEAFNERASWQSVLGPHGWVLDHESEGTGFWRRPGKAAGVSATTNHNGNDTLYVFTDATVLKQSGSYSKFGAFTALEHAGDWTAATRTLSQRSYGTFATWVEDDKATENNGWRKVILPNPCPPGTKFAKPGEGPPVTIRWGKVDPLAAAGPPPAIATAAADGPEPESAAVEQPRTEGPTDDTAEVIESGSTDPGPEPPPGPVERVRKYIAADDFAGLLRDSALLADLAILEAERPADLSALRAELKKARGVSVRDFNNAVKSMRPRRQPSEGENGPAPTAPVYRNAGGRFVLDLPGKDGGAQESIQLCNFFARIVEEVVRDNGDERVTRFRIEGVRHDGVELSAEVASSEFESMGWVVDQFGAKAIITAGRSMKEHVRAATQIFSADAIRRTVFTHTGWRPIDREWKYLHGGGAIGASGLDKSVTVDLVTEHKLTAYELPKPPDGPNLKRAVRASLGILRLGMDDRPRSRTVAAITLALPYRAAISRVNYAVQFNGPTGSHKSCLAALAQQHYGRGMGYNALPAAWNATANSLQSLRHALKEALLTVDDYVPGGSHREREKLDKTAEEVIRSQGNGQGRRRMGPDGKLRPPMDPRGSLLSTGEDRVSRASANYRTLGSWFDKDDTARGATGTVDKGVLTECQADADAGLYAASMSAFVRWLAPRYETIRDALPVRAMELRALATRPGDHGRTPDIVADLAAGFDVFLDFATDTGAIPTREADRVRRVVWDGLMDAAAEMRADHQDGADPADLFVQLIAAALSSNRAFLVDSKTGGDPDGIESSCGWRQELKWQGNDNGQIPMWVNAPNAQKIGWTDGSLVFLEPTASYNAAQQMLRDRGETLPAPETLRRMLFSAGKLARTDSRNGAEGKGRLTARETLEKQRRTVLVLRATEFWGNDATETETEPEPTFAEAEA